MANVLLLNPNQWGRGITHLWLCSHSALLKKNGHNVKVFDSTFYSDWSQDETGFNTKNQQYKPTDYENYIVWQDNITLDLQNLVDEVQPNIILVSAISSHIHGEG